jgi:hypothetical protein
LLERELAGVLKSGPVKILRLNFIVPACAKHSKALRAKCPGSRPVLGQIHRWTNTC